MMIIKGQPKVLIGRHYDWRTT